MQVNLKCRLKDKQKDIKIQKVVTMTCQTD